LSSLIAEKIERLCGWLKIAVFVPTEATHPAIAAR
jgi:hypothetical protein